MPNWCYNALDVSGPCDDLAEFAAQARGTVDGKVVALSLHALAPEPTALSDPAEWRRSTWGTKWDVTAVDLFEQNWLLTYTFSSAWSAPLPWLRKIAARFDTLTFVLSYAEPGDCFAGELVCKEGVDCAEYYTHDVLLYEEFVRANFPGCG